MVQDFGMDLLDFPKGSLGIPDILVARPAKMFGTVLAQTAKLSAIRSILVVHTDEKLGNPNIF